MSASLCPAAQMVASQLKESPEAAFLLDAEGIVLYENPPAKKLLFETTDQQYDKGAGDPRHAYHFSFLWTFSSPTKPWQDFFDELLQSDVADTTTTNYYNTSNHKRYDVTDDGLHSEEYDVVCKRTNGTEFPGSLRLSKVGACPCCESVYLCAYVKAKGGGMLDFQKRRVDNPFAKEDHSLKCILNASFDPVFSIDEFGTILMTNEAAVRSFGYTTDEFVGSNIKIICGGGHAELHDQYLRNYMDTGEQKIIGHKREVPARRKDGTEFSVELGVKEATCDDYGIDGRVVFIAFIKDLSMEKKHQEEMKHKMELMQGMIDSSFDPMFQINEKGIIQTLNNAAVALFGYRRDEMIGQNVSMICGGGHAEQHDAYMERYLNTGQKRVIGRKRQVTARRKGGQEFEIELGVQEVVSHTGEKLFCGFVRDLTQQMLQKKRMRKHEQTMKGNFFGQNGQKGGLDHSTTM